MHRIRLVLALVVGAWAMVAAVAVADEKVRILDACDPATFNAVVGPGTCADVGGDVTFAEFLNVLPEGHPGWRNEPSYIRIKPGERVKVTNEGGETHTFTEVKAFGGGFIPVLNLTESPIAPECVSDDNDEVPNPALVFIRSGGKLQVTGLDDSTPTHLFQCCIHPWMRAAIKVVAGEE